MSRLLLVPCVALVMLLPCWTWAQDPFANGEANAPQEDDPFGRPPEKATGEKVARQPKVWTAAEIEAALNEPLKAPMEYEDQPLNEILSVLQADFDLQMIFDMSALSEFAISPETEVSVSLRNVSLRKALELIFRQPGLEDLTYVVDDGFLLITTQEAADEKLMVKLYRVDDFSFDVLAGKYEGADRRVANLLQVIVSCVEYDTWNENGTGVGELHLLKPGILVISQPRRVHEQVDRLLREIREMRAEIEGDSAQLSDK